MKSRSLLYNSVLIITLCVLFPTNIFSQPFKITYWRTGCLRRSIPTILTNSIDINYAIKPVEKVESSLSLSFTKDVLQSRWTNYRGSFNRRENVFLGLGINSTLWFNESDKYLGVGPIVKVRYYMRKRLRRPPRRFWRGPPLARIFLELNIYVNGLIYSQNQRILQSDRISSGAAFKIGRVQNRFALYSLVSFGYKTIGSGSTNFTLGLGGSVYF
jgi:hypothetical protein